MNKKTKAYLHVVITPFVVAAAVEFLPFWLAWPSVLLGVMVWIGACIQMTEKEA